MTSCRQCCRNTSDLAVGSGWAALHRHVVGCVDSFQISRLDTPLPLLWGVKGSNSIAISACPAHDKLMDLTPTREWQSVELWTLMLCFGWVDYTASKLVSFSTVAENADPFHQTALLTQLFSQWSFSWALGQLSLRTLVWHPNLQQCSPMELFPSTISVSGCVNEPLLLDQSGSRHIYPLLNACCSRHFITDDGLR